ncbi:MAG: helix-turn-helix transcriptional regulator [Bacteroidales bacterium]|jgi:DNA-binding CsgD family transcriptional regulator|nr:helix-turn-helix transcriptional regulator [Bacteroidales bacterium]
MANKQVSIKQQFFAPIKHEIIPKAEYKRLAFLPDLFEKVSRVTNQSLYIIDYSKENFYFVSSHPLFLCGYTPEEVTKMGYSFYEQVLSPEDLQMLLEVNKLGWESFYKVKPTKRVYGCFSYDFYLHHKNGSKTLITHKISPIFLSKTRNIWLALCTVTLSSQKSSGNVIFTLNNMSDYYTYDFGAKQTIKYEPKLLNERERVIFALMMRGFSDTDIAKELNISYHTVRTYHKHIVQKLDVSNSTCAVVKFHTQF